MSTITDGELLSIYQIVGRFIIMYGRIEMSLTHIAIVVFEHAGGQREKWAKFPRQMKGRKEFLDASFEELSALAAYRSEWQSIQKDMARPEEIRNGIVHGVWDGKTGELRGQITFRRMAPDGSPNVEILETSARELRDADNVVFELVRRTAVLADRLDKAFIRE